LPDRKFDFSAATIDREQVYWRLIRLFASGASNRWRFIKGRLASLLFGNKFDIRYEERSQCIFIPNVFNPHMERTCLQADSMIQDFTSHHSGKFLWRGINNKFRRPAKNYFWSMFNLENVRSLVALPYTDANVRNEITYTANFPL